MNDGQTFIATTGSGIARATGTPSGEWSVVRLLEAADVRCLTADPLNPALFTQGQTSRACCARTMVERTGIRQVWQIGEFGHWQPAPFNPESSTPEPSRPAYTSRVTEGRAGRRWRHSAGCGAGGGSPLQSRVLSTFRPLSGRGRLAWAAIRDTKGKKKRGEPICLAHTHDRDSNPPDAFITSVHYQWYCHADSSINVSFWSVKVKLTHLWHVALDANPLPHLVLAILALGLGLPAARLGVDLNHAARRRALRQVVGDQPERTPQRL
jgi:hypothetical protein